MYAVEDLQDDTHVSKMCRQALASKIHFVKSSKCGHITEAEWLPTYNERPVIQQYKFAVVLL